MKKLISLSIFVALVLSSCGGLVVNGGPGNYNVKTNPEGVSYELFYIEEMPCMRIGRSTEDGGIWDYDGVTCDWSKWSGNE